ncbi:MAG: hypothetical protein Q9187_003438 [Circinaria calcarea]
MSPFEFMWMATRIWGGSNATHPNHAEVDEKVMGIVCPQLAVLLNVLNDPKSVCEFGLSKGLMSSYEGSRPMLPRDPISGFVLAGNARCSLERRFIRDHLRMTPNEVEPDHLPLTLGAHLQEDTLYALIRGWNNGELVLQLQPSIVLYNLLMPTKGLQDVIKPWKGYICKIINVTRSDLLTTGVTTGEFIVGGGVGVFCTGAKIPSVRVIMARLSNSMDIPDSGSLPRRV